MDTYLAGWHFQLFESADYSSKVRRRHSIQLEVQSQFVEVSGLVTKIVFLLMALQTALCTIRTTTTISKHTGTESELY